MRVVRVTWKSRNDSFTSGITVWKHNMNDLEFVELTEGSEITWTIIAQKPIPRRKVKMGAKMSKMPISIIMTSIFSSLSQILLKESYKRRSMGRIGIRRQESHKEMAMNYEIPFARAQNQLHAAKISSGGDKIGKKRSIFRP